MDDATPPSKQCGSCQQTLPLETFNRRAASPDGRMARCRSCDSEYKKAHRAARPEHYRQYETRRYAGERRERTIAAARTRYQADPEAWNEAQRERYWRDVAATRARQNAYRAAHPEMVREAKRRDYERHGEQIRAKQVARYAADPAKYIQQVLAYQRAKPEWARERTARYRARKLKATVGVLTVELLAAKLAYYGGRCWMCGADWTDWDHVKPLAKGGPHMLANLRPACQPCNSSKSDRWPFPTATR